MQSSGKLIGLMLIAGGLLCGAIGGLWAFTQQATEKLDSGGLVFAIGGLAILALPAIFAGIFMFVRGGREDVELRQIAKERKILNMVSTQGQVKIPEVALELNATRDQIKEWIYDLVGKGLFSGYINWDDGVLYSKQASQLKTGQCPNCGAKLELAGKGVVKCAACGSEIFLS
jgi:hypothetical protein